MFIACLAETMFVFLAQLLKCIYTCKILFRPGGQPPGYWNIFNMLYDFIYVYLLLATWLYYKVAKYFDALGNQYY